MGFVAQQTCVVEMSYIIYNSQSTLIFFNNCLFFFAFDSKIFVFWPIWMAAIHSGNQMDWKFELLLYFDDDTQLLWNDILYDLIGAKIII